MCEDIEILIIKGEFVPIEETCPACIKRGESC